MNKVSCRMSRDLEETSMRRWVERCIELTMLVEQ